MESVVEMSFFINNFKNFPKAFHSAVSKAGNLLLRVFTLNNCPITASELLNPIMFIELWPLMLESHGEKLLKVHSLKVRNPNCERLWEACSMR